MMKRSIIWVSAVLAFLSVSDSFSSPSNGGARKKGLLKKVGELPRAAETDSAISFWLITGMCCDKENNIYIADSGQNRIFKFDGRGRLLASFGRVGQGPGEFLGSGRGGSNLRLSYGNNKEIYVMDPGNKRLSAFSMEGRFLRHFWIRGFLPDSATVDSKGNIYLLSRSGINLVDCYDADLKYQASFIELEAHLLFPLGRPPLHRLDLRIPNDYEVIKTIADDDKLIIVSNYAMRIFAVDTACNKTYMYEIDDIELRKDLAKRLSEQKTALANKRLRVNSGPRMVLPSNSILPFRAFIYQDNRLFLGYRNSDLQFEIYEHGLSRGFLSVYRFPEPVDGFMLCSDKDGQIYATMEGRTKVGIFRIIE